MAVLSKPEAEFMARELAKSSKLRRITMKEAQQVFERHLVGHSPIVAIQGKINGEEPGIREAFQAVVDHFKKKGRTLTFHQLSEAFLKAARKLKLLQTS